MKARVAFAFAIAFFVVTRAVLHFGLAPFFDGDSYKYLTGADALWAGAALPSLFRDLPTTGGALHAVPGYAYFIDAVWSIARRVTLPEVLIAQSVLSCAGLLAAADLVRRWSGPWPAVAVFAVLATCPTLAWLEHTLMPDVLAIPLFWCAAWWIVVAPFGRSGARGAVNGGITGLALAAQVLLRTSSQFFAPLVFAVAFLSRGDWRSFAVWSGSCAFSLALGVLPWVLHNHEIHGVYRLSQSQGRNLYFSALWSNTLDRAQLVEEYGIPGGAGVASSFAISGKTLRDLLDSGLSLPEADTAMWDKAAAAYAAKPVGEILTERYALMRGLFVESDGPGEWMHPLRSNVDDVLTNKFSADGWRTWAEKRLQYQLHEETIAAQARANGNSDAASTFLRGWIRALTFDGAPLLALYLLTMPLLLRMPRSRALAFVVFAAPPLAYLAVFAVFGAPLYRYQAALHPFLLATAVLGLCSAKRGQAPFPVQKARVLHENGA